MSKCKKYVKGGGINPFWLMDQMEEHERKKYGITNGASSSTSTSNNSININININIGDCDLDDDEN